MEVVNMGNLTQAVERKAFSVAIDATLKKLNKDREKALLQLVDLAEKFMGDNFRKDAYDGARAMIKNPDHKWMRYVNRLLDETDPHVAKMTALNLGYQAAFYGTKTIRKMREVHNCNIPWLILMDPTSACNLHCTGCWAAEYGNKLNLTFDELDSIVTQGKELGVYFYMTIGSYCWYLYLKSTIHVAQYNIVYHNEASIFLMILGFFLLIVSQIILLGKDLKEEHELTI